MIALFIGVGGVLIGWAAHSAVTEPTPTKALILLCGLVAMGIGVGFNLVAFRSVCKMRSLFKELFEMLRDGDTSKVNDATNGSFRDFTIANSGFITDMLE